MEDNRIIAACGLVCSECDAYKATKASDATEIARVAEQWSKMYNADIRPEGVWCDGCMTRGERKCGHCGECKTRACNRERGTENCAQCSDYPCDQIKEFFKMVPSTQDVLEGLRG